MTGMSVVLFLSVTIAWSAQDLEVQIEWNGGRGELVPIGALAEPTAGTGEVVFYEDFESGGEDWEIEHNVWQVGKSKVVPPSPGSGGNCAGTVLNEDYPWDTDSRLISPPVTLPTVAGDERIELRYWQWYAYSYSNDVGYVQVARGDSDQWDTLTNPTGTRSPEVIKCTSDWSLVADSPFV